MKNLIIILSLIFILFSACSSSTEQSMKSSNKYLKTGIWRGVLKPQGIEVPFIFKVKKLGSKYSFILINGEEQMVLDDITIRDDSLHAQLFVFDATIHAKIEDENLHGVWVKNDVKNYAIPFNATFGNNPRFSVESKIANASFDGKWEVDFIKDHGVEKAIGLFSQHEKKLTGTFLTATGDYRFLEGVVDGSKMKLSSFDGVNALLFEAEMLNNGEISGELWNLMDRHEKWTAKRNENFELVDTYAITFLKEGYDNFSIKFPNTSGDLVELTNERYEDKVVVVQILGTWCPNCIDETRFLVEWYRKNKDRKVEIIGLAFENNVDVVYAASRVNKWKKKLGMEYEVLMAGIPSARAEALPMLNEIVTFPTTIILDKQHKVRQIQSGFFGPGSGVYYEKFIKDFNNLIDKLVEE